MFPILRLAALATLALGCTPRGTEATPPRLSEPAPSAQVAPPAVSTVSSAQASAPAAAEPGSANAGAAVASPAPAREPAPSTDPPPVEEAPLFDESGAPLPQTEERPNTEAPLFKAHAEALFTAIVADDPELAMRFFFPRVAYEQVKDVQNPGLDWERRLVAAFERNVHEYHRVLGKRGEGATLVGLEVPESRAQWMKPGREGNRIGYFRVLHARLRWRDAEGKERDFDVTSLISWRGHWYVVHLHGFK